MSLLKSSFLVRSKIAASDNIAFSNNCSSVLPERSFTEIPPAQPVKTDDLIGNCVHQVGKYFSSLKIKPVSGGQNGCSNFKKEILDHLSDSDILRRFFMLFDLGLKGQH